MDADLARANLDPRCMITSAYLDARKRCSVDTDCAIVSYQPGCCDNVVVTGVAASSAEEVRQCDAQKPECRCGEAAAPNRADDGRATAEDAFSDVEVRCVEQQCQTSVRARKCGMKHECKAHEICVSYGGVPGGPQPNPEDGDNAYLTFVCTPNPCEGPLDCDCAQVACNEREDAVRKCEIALISESDVACVPQRD